MEKKDIKLSMPKIKKFDFQDERIEVNPYINLENKYVLLNNYIQVLNNPEYDETRKYVEAEYGVKLGIIDLQTNINIENLDIDMILSSGLFDAVASTIVNYNEMWGDIAEIVNRVNDSKSVSVALVKLTDKVIVTLDQLSKVDLSEEGISKLLSAFNVEKEKLNKIIPVVETKKPSTRKSNKTRADLVQ